MTNNILRHLFAAIFIGAIMTSLGCSSGSSPLISEYSRDKEMAVNTGGQCLGEFSLALDPDLVTAKIEPVIREGAFNVTRYVNIKIVGLKWDATTRIWDVDATVENPTKYNAYGPWVVFLDTGEQKILDQDGFLELGPPVRYPVIAFCKENPQRVFNAHSIEKVHIRIHWPDGWNSFNPMQFMIDASFPGPRQQPIVEKLQIWQDSPIPEQFNLAGYIKDWQVPPEAPGLEVWVDLTPIGGSDHVSLFDDGAHHDGAAGDDIWGCDFMAVPPPNPTPLTVGAIDWESYYFENDVIFGQQAPPDCLPMVEIESGQWGFDDPYEAIIRAPASWGDFWAKLHPGEEPPFVNFAKAQVVIAMLGWRPSSGYWVRMDCIKELRDTQGNPFTSVTYTEMKPGDNCMVLWVIQYPYKIVSTPITKPPDAFDHLLYAYPCP